MYYEIIVRLKNIKNKMNIAYYLSVMTWHKIGA